MAELTLEQKRALALARARQRAAQAQQPAPAPDAAPQAEAAREGTWGGALGQLVQGAGQGIGGLLGIPGSIFNLESKLVGNALGYENPPQLPTGQQGMQSIAGAITGDTEPVGQMERRARALGEYVGPSALTGGIGGVAGALAGAGSGAASGLAAGQVREMGGGAGAEAVASLLAGGLAVGAGNQIAKARQAREIVDAVPSVADLKAEAGALYDAGEATGKTAARGYTQRFADEMTKLATDEGLILPSGEMMGTYPKVTAALRMIGQYGGQKMAPDQMRQVRRVFQDAAQSVDPAEARIGAKMLKQLDRFVDPLVPEFGQANKVYARAMRGKEIETATEIATEGRRSSTTAAIANEFQNLTRKGIRGDLTYPPELEAAVRQAANGSRTRQIAEGLGNLAPTPNNVVRSGLGLGTAATAGATVGGPLMGLATAGGGAGAGLMARLLAANLAKNDANLASAIARNGGPLAEAQTPEAVRAAIAALLASQAARAGQP